jgi:suppressor for copper-sensitivity B
LILLKFILENAEGIWARTKFKIAAILIIFGASLYLPEAAHKEDIRQEEFISSIWTDFDQNKLEQYIKQGKIVIVDVSASWCAACRFNKLSTWNREKTVTFLKEHNVIAMRASYNRDDQAIYDFLIRNGAYGIPFAKIYGPSAPQGIKLPTVIFFSDIQSAIDLAS